MFRPLFSDVGINMFSINGHCYQLCVISGKFRYNYIINIFKNFDIRKRNCRYTATFGEIRFLGLLVKAIRLRLRVLLGNMQKLNFVYGLCDGNASAAQRVQDPVVLFPSSVVISVSTIFHHQCFWYAVFFTLLCFSVLEQRKLKGVWFKYSIIVNHSKA